MCLSMPQRYTLYIYAHANIYTKQVRDVILLFWLLTICLLLLHVLILQMLNSLQQIFMFYI